MWPILEVMILGNNPTTKMASNFFYQVCNPVMAFRAWQQRSRMNNLNYFLKTLARTENNIFSSISSKADYERCK